MFDDSSPAGLLTVVEQSCVEESAMWARRMAAFAQLLGQRTAEEFDAAQEAGDSGPGYALITGFARTCCEVGAAMNISPYTARRMISQAEALDTRLPKIATLLASGQLSWSDTTAIITRTGQVDAEVIGGIDTVLAERISGWQCWSRRRLLNTVDAAIHRADPDGAKERRRRADTDARVTVTSEPNGMARINAYVGAPAGVQFDNRLTLVANTVCGNDPRTLDQRRAAAVDALGNGTFMLGCLCDHADCPVIPAEAQTAGRAQFVVNVVAGADTLTGRSDAPGYLDGYGVIDADQVRDLADRGALLRPTSAAADNDTGDLLRHQPSAAQARWVRSRSLTCSFPGCNRSAWRADLDHSVPFDHQHPLRGGWTMTANLGPKCREHHRLKTFECGWQDTQLVDGTVEWTSPTGRVYRSTPDGAELFDDIAQALPTPRRRNHRENKAQRTAAARAGMAAKRAANTETRRINQARAQEIQARTWRNEMRFKLFLFKGTPSTSPFCTWVNDPHEDEAITADWKPPPEPPTTEYDKPPF